MPSELRVILEGAQAYGCWICITGHLVVVEDNNFSLFAYLRCILEVCICILPCILYGSVLLRWVTYEPVCISLSCHHCFLSAIVIQETVDQSTY